MLISYCPEGNGDIINSVLFDIINCEADLVSHCQVEDRLLVPAVARAEISAIRTAPVQEEHHNSRETSSILGKREKEIVACIARGLSNKEIAEQLCISVHTVTTHRRNICQKLEIHSPPALRSTPYSTISSTPPKYCFDSRGRNKKCGECAGGVGYEIVDICASAELHGVLKQFYAAPGQS